MNRSRVAWGAVLLFACISLAESQIIEHPRSTVVTAGRSVFLSTRASGGGVSYQWQRNATDLPGATAASYFINAATNADAGRYRCRVTLGNGTQQFSNEVTLTVLAPGTTPRFGLSSVVPLGANPTNLSCDDGLCFVSESGRIAVLSVNGTISEAGAISVDSPVELLRANSEGGVLAEFRNAEGFFEIRLAPGGDGFASSFVEGTLVDRTSPPSRPSEQTAVELFSTGRVGSGPGAQSLATRIGGGSGSSCAQTDDVDEDEPTNFVRRLFAADWVFPSVESEFSGARTELPLHRFLLSPGAIQRADTEVSYFENQSGACEFETIGLSYLATLVPAWVALDTQGESVDMSLVDLNRDFAADVITVEAGPAAGVRDGTWRLCVYYGPEHTRAFEWDGLGAPGTVAAADLNFDGVSDIVVTDELNDSVEVFLGTAGGSLCRGAPIQLSNSARPKGIQALDIDGDGWLEVLVAESGLNRISVWRVSGTDPAACILDCAGPTAIDCDDNGLSDHCEIVTDPLLDCDGNRTLDRCQTDSDGDGRIDDCDPCPDFSNCGCLNEQCRLSGSFTLQALAPSEFLINDLEGGFALTGGVHIPLPVQRVERSFRRLRFSADGKVAFAIPSSFSETNDADAFSIQATRLRRIRSTPSGGYPPAYWIFDGSRIWDGEVRPFPLWAQLRDLAIIGGFDKYTREDQAGIRMDGGVYEVIARRTYFEGTACTYSNESAADWSKALSSRATRVDFVDGFGSSRQQYRDLVVVQPDEGGVRHFLDQGIDCAQQIHRGYSEDDNDDGDLIAIGGEPGQLVVANFDGGNKEDFAVTNLTTGAIEVRYGPRFDTKNTSLPSCGTPHTLISADWDGDGYPGLALSDFENRRILIYRNIGGTFCGADVVLLPVGVVPGDITSVDADNDGLPDIVFAANEGTMLGTILNNTAIVAAPCTAIGPGPDCNSNGMDDGCEPDRDGDGVIDDCDSCPDDPDKTDPGDCGCGAVDNDSDGDGTPDCVDGCPNDPNKTDPGTCGCGVLDIDSDGDGVSDCNDGCPNDPSKTEKGGCGCGVSDRDTDGDGTPDCDDDCPNDSNKIEPGACGCGRSDVDANGNGTPDCNDGSPLEDPDTDGDGVPDTSDDCPNDPNKTTPGTCGCGVAETDSDGDGVADCNDDCPDDANKTNPGECGCGKSDADANNDGTPDCQDVPVITDPNTDTDTDGDGVPDDRDGCPNDRRKTRPGACGCGVPDTDSDSDGTADCEDECPNDPNKLAPGECGCDVPEGSCACGGIGVAMILVSFVGFVRTRRARTVDPKRI